MHKQRLQGLSSLLHNVLSQSCIMGMVKQKFFPPEMTQLSAMLPLQMTLKLLDVISSCCQVASEVVIPRYQCFEMEEAASRACQTPSQNALSRYDSE